MVYYCDIYIKRNEQQKNCLVKVSVVDWSLVRIFNSNRHPWHIEAAAVVMYMYLYGLAFTGQPCTLSATVCHQAPPFPLYTRPRARQAGLGGSVGCAVRLETRRSGVQSPPRSATFFHGDWSWNIFYGHSLPSADSRRAVVSFWRKNVHNTG